MKEINKKALVAMGITIILIVSLVVYFTPLSLSDVLKGDARILISISDLIVENNNSKIDYSTYDDLSSEQTEEIKQVLNNYTYKRNITTFFSDGSVSGAIEKILYIYIYNETGEATIIMIASDNQMLVNLQAHTMKRASDLINQIMYIVEK